MKFSEKKKIIEYYNEIYGDKADSGMTEEEILAGFGTPQEVARKILEESGLEYKEPAKETRNFPSFVVGMVVFTLFIGIPLLSVAVSVVGAAFSVFVSGFAAGIVGIVYVLVAPLYYFVNGMAGMAIVAWMGLGIVAVGVGIFLVIGGWYALKYSIIGSWKIFKSIYKWRK